MWVRPHTWTSTPTTSSTWDGIEKAWIAPVLEDLIFFYFYFCRPCFHALLLPAFLLRSNSRRLPLSLYSEHRQRKPSPNGRIVRSAIFISADGSRHHQIVLIGLLVRPGDGITLVTRYAVEFLKASHGVHCWIVFFMRTGFWIFVVFAIDCLAGYCEVLEHMGWIYPSYYFLLSQLTNIWDIRCLPKDSFFGI